MQLTCNRGDSSTFIYQVFYWYIHTYTQTYIHIYQHVKCCSYGFLNRNSFSSVNLVLLAPIYRSENWGMGMKWLAHHIIAGTLVLGGIHKSSPEPILYSATFNSFSFVCHFYLLFGGRGAVGMRSSVTLHEKDLFSFCSGTA